MRAFTPGTHDRGKLHRRRYNCERGVIMPLWGMGDTSQPTTDKIHSRKGSTGAGYYFSFFGGDSCPEYVTAGIYAVCFITTA